MATAQTWAFKCGHTFTLIPSHPNHSSQPQLIQALVQAEQTTSPDSCPNCREETRKSEEQKQTALAELRKALEAYKSHGQMLDSQLLSSAGNPAVAEVYENLKGDCLLYQAEKIREIWRMKGLTQAVFDSKATLDQFCQLENEKDALKIMEVAAGVALEREIARWGKGSPKVLVLQEQLEEWQEINDELSLVLEDKHTAEYVARAQHDMEKCWSRVLSMIN